MDTGFSLVLETLGSLERWNLVPFAEGGMVEWQVDTWICARHSEYSDWQVGFSIVPLVKSESMDFIDTTVLIHMVYVQDFVDVIKVLDQVWHQERKSKHTRIEVSKVVVF